MQDKVRFKQRYYLCQTKLTTHATEFVLHNLADSILAVIDMMIDKHAHCMRRNICLLDERVKGARRQK